MTKAFRRIVTGVGAAAIAVIVAGAGYQHLSAQGPGGGFGGPGGGRGGPMGRGGPGGPGGPLGGMLGPMMAERLELTSDQRDRMRQVLDSHRDELRALGDRAMKGHEALQDAITGTFDESAIRARAADVAAVDADQAVAQARIFGEAIQILTSAQLEELKKMQAEMKQRMEKRSQRPPRPERGGQR